MSADYEIGIVGLGTMGQNLLLNIADHGFKGIGLDKDPKKVDGIQKDREKFKNTEAVQDVKSFLDKIRKPRAVLLLVPAGAPVDAVIAELSPLMAKDDLIIDAGNSKFKDTDAREKSLKEKGIHFFGMGVSGGEAGARNGPSMMPGGDKVAYERLRPLLEAIAAKVKGVPCVEYLGPKSAGHYVKMIHNGIEYGLMQLISETYYLMKTALNLNDDECHRVYGQWNSTELNSYLLEITSRIFLTKDDKGDGRLVDKILDVAKQKGTGSWTCQDAMELQVPVPTIDAAVSMRDLSGFQGTRKEAHETLKGPAKISAPGSEKFLGLLKNAYYSSAIITYAQGMALLQKASATYKYDLNLETVAKIWRGGCIIRAAVLEQIMTAFRKSPQLSNLLLDPTLRDELGKRQDDLRAIIQTSVAIGAPVPGMMASLSYYDGYRSAWLPTNLIQAQRDFFGAHTFERKDLPGTFHSHWEG
jgi:6-phosphogluconate dehydrogenase